MPRYMVHSALALFTAVALTGVLMRLAPFQGMPYMGQEPLLYTNVLHGHSHLAILGWAFLGVFLVFLAVEWSSFRSKIHANTLFIMIFVVSALMFAAFLHEGYGVTSIILSTVHIFVEYWAALFIYRHLKKDGKLPVVGKLYIKGSLLALIISSIGPFSLGFISASGLKGSGLFDMAIYFYLHFQYNGWLYLALIGMLIFILHRKGIHINKRLLQTGFWFYFLALFPGYFLSILWADVGTFAYILAVLGSIGQWIGVVCILFAIGTAWRTIRIRTAKIVSGVLGFTFFLLFVKSTMELGLIFPGLAELIYQTRSVIIGYLHFTLLGFISTFIIAQFMMVDAMDVFRRSTAYGLGIFLAGFIANELLLFTKGLFQWLGAPVIPFAAHGLLIASLILLVGILVMWYASFQNNHTVYK